MSDKRIIYSTAEGGVAIVVPAPNSGLTIEEIAAKDCPAGASYEIVDVSAVPTDRTFRNAWTRSGKAVQTDIPKAKLIAHEVRRAKRAAEFAPLDIEATIPAKATQAEAARAAIRAKYDAMQNEIDAASTEMGLKAALENTQ
ncbi:MAG: hypothetical protein ACKOW0_00800 [Schleiferiaceae bacterium]